ncbi:unnamed protein product [Closterium sp. Yama58-4]|nr:unnamed protein product [Closterium sp. Yama58-4]
MDVNKCQASDVRLPAMSLIERLSEDLLATILHLVGRPDGQFQHALVCKKWYRVAHLVHDQIQIRKIRRMRPHELLAHLSSFPRLRKLVLAEGSLSSVPDSLLSRIADSCPDLTDLHVDSMERLFRRGGFTERGLSYLLERCTRLESLRLHCQSNLTAIPSSIGGLVSLKSLRIDGGSRLPDAFTSLQALAHLEIEMYGLDELSQDFGNLRLLKSLHLNNCMRLRFIPDSFGQLTNLTHLSIRSSGSLQLPESISNLSSLLTFEISTCEDLAPLPERFGNLSALETLRLEEVGGITDLPASLGNLQRLRLLSVINCCDIHSLPDSLSHLTSLTDLILLDLTLDRLPHGVGQLPCLSMLNLDVGDLFLLPPSACLAASLKELSLENSSALRSLPEEFGQLTALESLGLGKLSQLASLPASFGNLTSLAELEIVNCSLLTQLPDSLTRLSSLELLEIRYCCNLTELPQGMGDGLRSLRELKLVECTALTLLPPSLSNLSSLETLEIRDALNLHGTLPGGFARSTSLKKLALSFLPHLPASLPAIARTLTSLELLSCNQITALPEEIGHLGALEKLRLSKLPDLKSLPRSLCRLQRLKFLEVNSCSALQTLFGDEHLGTAGHDLGGRITCLSLGGEASSSFSCRGTEETGESVFFPSLEVLKLAALPLQLLGPSLGSFPSLTKLEILEMHRLVSFPDSISRLSRLQSLTVCDAKSLLSLPETLGRLSALTSLQLDNLLSLTELPESFGQLKMLQYLRLYGSPVLARLPDSFPNLCRLEVCRFSNIGISCLPNDFCKLSSLEELSLRECGQLARLPTGLQQMAKLLACTVDDCPLLQAREVVIYGTANLDEGERVPWSRRMVG